MAYDLINFIENELTELRYKNKLNLNNIEILFSYNHIQGYIKLINESDENENRFKEIIIDEFLKPEINELNKYLDSENKIEISE